MGRKTFLANEIENLLNTHSYLQFKVKEHVADLDTFYADMLNEYRLESPHFWALLTDYMGEYIPIPDANSTIESCVIYLHVPNKFLADAFNFLKNDFSRDVVAKELDDNGHKSIMTMNIPEAIEENYKDGIDYTIIRIMFSFKSSSKFVFGNSVKIKLNGVEITPFDGRQLDHIIDNEEIAYLGNVSKASKARTNINKHSHIFYYENGEPFENLLYEITSGQQNTVYELEYTFPNNNVQKFRVRLESSSYVFPLGQFIFLNCVFASAGV